VAKPKGMLVLATLLAVLVVARAQQSSPGLAFTPYERFGPYKTAALYTPDIGTFYYPVAKSALWPLPQLPVFIFACGTYQISYEYAPTLRHLASHGLLVLGVQDAKTKVMTPEVMGRAIDFVRDAKVLRAALPAALHGRIDASRLAVGGHSGGGPVALEAAAALLARAPAAGGRPAVQGFVAQHAAAIPEDNPQKLQPNRPREAHLGALAAEGASMLSLCGGEPRPRLKPSTAAGEAPRPLLTPPGAASAQCSTTCRTARVRTPSATTSTASRGPSCS